MRKLVAFVVVLVALGLVGDVAAREAAEGQIETTARQEVRADSVSASISSFPFVARVVLTGTVRNLRVKAVEVPAGRVTFSAVDLDLHGVRIDRETLRRERRVELVAIDSGTVSAEIAGPVLTKLVGRQVQLGASGSVQATVERGNVLVLSRPGLFGALRVPIPTSSLVPCVSRVTVLAGRVRLSCTLEDVPPALIKAINRPSESSR